eukprot:scaffold6679_cov144-Amphora_coffeaeformis.AAC.2
MLSPSSFLSMIPSRNFFPPSMLSSPEQQRPKEFLEAEPLVSSEQDILLGRGTLHAKHPGNKNFYKIVDTFIPRYHAAKSKSEKSDLLHSIYRRVLAAGLRFVKHDDGDDRTRRVVTKKEAKEKIGHTMRYRQKLHGQKACRKLSSSSSSSTTTFLQAKISRSSSLQSLVTESSNTSSHVVDMRPLPPPPKLAKHVFLGSDQRIATGKNNMNISIFSDRELLSVLGSPGEMELATEEMTITLPPGEDWDVENEGSTSAASKCEVEKLLNGLFRKPCMQYHSFRATWQWLFLLYPYDSG